MITSPRPLGTWKGSPRSLGPGGAGVGPHSPNVHAIFGDTPSAAPISRVMDVPLMPSQAPRDQLRLLEPWEKAGKDIARNGEPYADVALRRYLDR